MGSSIPVCSIARCVIGQQLYSIFAIFWAIRSGQTMRRFHMWRESVGSSVHLRIYHFFPLFFPSARNDKQRMIYCSGHAYRLLFAVAANQWPITGMKSDGKAGFPLHALEYLPLGLVYWANLLKLIKTKASQRFQLLKQLSFFSWPLIFFTSSCKNIIDKSLSSRRNERKNPFYCLLICACTKEWRSRASW